MNTLTATIYNAVQNHGMKHSFFRLASKNTIKIIGYFIILTFIINMSEELLWLMEFLFLGFAGGWKPSSSGKSDCKLHLNTGTFSTTHSQKKILSCILYVLFCFFSTSPPWTMFWVCAFRPVSHHQFLNPMSFFFLTNVNIFLWQKDAYGLTF